MIKEINKQELYERAYAIFPKVHIDQYRLTSLNIYTTINLKDNYYIEIKKSIDKYGIDNKGLDYAELMKFIDSIQVDINSLKKNFKLENWETTPLMTCYKIIE